jgi:hypothetical protein
MIARLSSVYIIAAGFEVVPGKNVPDL